MAQPLARPEDANSSIDTAGARLEKAIRRLEAAVAHVTAAHHSLKGDREKLNHLLRETEEKSAELKQVAGTVIKRLNITIDKLEQMEE